MQQIAVKADQTQQKQLDLIEWYFEQGWTDGLPVVPPTPEKVESIVTVLGGQPDTVEARVPPRWGNLTREVLAINMVMAGCQPNYAPVVRAAAGHNSYGRAAAGGQWSNPA